MAPFILSIISPFSTLFSSPVWKRCLTLFSGAILCRGKRTVCAALRVMGLDHEKHFSSYHHVLNRVKWSPLYAAKILLCLIVKVTGTQKPLVLFINETLERRKGPKIKAKGYYRDAVRSSKQNVVKTSGELCLPYVVTFLEGYEGGVALGGLATGLVKGYNGDYLGSSAFEDPAAASMEKVGIWVTGLLGAKNQVAGAAKGVTIFSRITLPKRPSASAEIISAKKYQEA